METLDTCIIAFLTGFLVTYCLTPLVRALAIRCNILDRPDRRRIHARPIPRCGGLAVILGFYAASVVVFLLLGDDYQGALNFVWWRHFAVSATILALVGLADDIWGLRPTVKLLGQILAASTLFFLQDIHFGKVLGHSLPWPIDFAIVILWCLLIINAFNLIDGLDGLASGLATISALGLAGSFLILRVTPNAIIPLALAGACLAFLRYNFYPARIFLGDTGSMFLGFTLASVALSAQAKSTFVASIGIALLAVGVPIFDTLLAIWRRSIRLIMPQALRGHLAPKGLMQPDKEHLHHRFLYRGLKQSHVAVALYLLNAGMIIYGLILLSIDHQSLGFFFIAFIIGICLIVRHAAYVELWDTGLALFSGIRRPRIKEIINLLYPFWDVLSLCGSLLLAIYVTSSTSSFHGVKEEFIRTMIYWVTPCFLCLWAAKTYSRVWSLAGFQDYLSLPLALFVGTVIGLLMVSINHGHLADLSIRGIVYASLSAVAITPIRFATHAVLQLMRNIMKNEEFKPTKNVNRVLVCGGVRGNYLYLKNWHMLPPQEASTTKIVGFVDEDSTLHRRLIQGHRVLGNYQDIAGLIQKHSIDQVVITNGVPPERRKDLIATVKKYDIPLFEWGLEERLVFVPASVPHDRMLA